jgi:hypothetical protein
VNTETIRSNLNSVNTFTKCDTGSNKVKLPKVGSNAIVPVPVGGRAQRMAMLYVQQKVENK